MRVKMITLECGPNGTFNSGDERDVSEARGLALVAGRHAVEISPRQLERAVVAPPEMAVINTPEAAVLPAPETRGRGRQRK